VEDALIPGRPRPAAGDAAGITLRELCNKFLTSKRTDVDLGKLSPRTFVHYSRTTGLLIDAFGKDPTVSTLGPADFETLYAKLAGKHGLSTLSTVVTMVRSVFEYAAESDLIDPPVKYGPRFKAPTKSDKRKHKAKQKHANGAKMFQAAEIRKMLDAAGLQLQAMILLGINCGMGNSDCATLPISALDLKAGWREFPHPKTGIERRVPLWKETIAALQAVIAKRKKPKDEKDSGLVLCQTLILG
jgi:integrase